MNNPYSEICKHCGCTYGAHHAGTSPWPRNYCPGHEGKMDWDEGPGTVFGATGIYKEKNNQEDLRAANISKSLSESFDKCAEDKWTSGMVQGMPEDGDILL